jgi:flagellar protein FlaI
VSDPLVDASLPDGSRIQLTLGSDISPRGSNFTIRKFADVPYTPVDLVNWNTFSVEQLAYFWLAIENNRSLVFAGGTGSGKTTSMNAVSMFIPPSSKVVSIEDTRELTLPHRNWIQSVSRPPVTATGRGEVSMYHVLQASLRQRPEYLLVGEIRTEQNVAFTFFQAMATGHTSYTTVHADSVESALSRLQNEPLSVPAQMVQELDVLAIQRQIYTGDRRVRRAEEIAEIVPADHGSVAGRSVFERDARDDVHERVGTSLVLAEIAEERGWTEDDLRGELGLREEVLTYLVETDVDDYTAVTTTIHTFSKDPGFVVGAMRDGTFDPSNLGERGVGPREDDPEGIDVDDVEETLVDDDEPMAASSPRRNGDDPAPTVADQRAPGAPAEESAAEAAAAKEAAAKEAAAEAAAAADADPGDELEAYDFDRDELEAYDFDRDDLATYEAESDELARFEFGGDDHAAAEEDER